ncbi:MAG: peptide-methionine (R)-S-oxide reductase, partial [Akkermansiaceae bacterium]
MKTKLTLILAAITLVFSAACAEEKNKEKAMETAKEAPQEPTEKIVKTDEEWKKILTPEQYRILRQAGTERPNGDVYHEFKKQGEGAYH